jgi:hypothetical protein
MFWTNIASIIAWPNFKNGPKNRLSPLGVKNQNDFAIYNVANNG